MAKITDKKSYQVLVPFMFADQKQNVGDKILLNDRQAANLVAGGFVKTQTTAKK